MASQQESSKPPTKSGEHHQSHHQSSTSDLFASAKVLAGAAQSAFGHDGSAVDRAKVAEAGEELLEAASKYGKLDDKGYGSYIEKAEGYLHQFHSSEKPTKPSTPEKAAEGGHSTPEVVEEEKYSKEESGGGFGGFGDFAKAAQGFLSK